MSKTEGGQKVFGRKVTFPDGRTVGMGRRKNGDSWIIKFTRPPKKEEGTKEISTEISLSDEAMSALVNLYLGFASLSMPPYEKSKSQDKGE